MRAALLLTMCIATLFAGDALADAKVGVIVPLSGDFARYGEIVRRGVERARSPITKLVFEDEGCAPLKAVNAYKKLTAADGVRVIIGPSCGSSQIAVASLLSKSNQVAFLGSSAPRRVFDLSAGRMFSVQHSIEEESEANAKILFERGSRRVVILFF